MEVKMVESTELKKPAPKVGDTCEFIVGDKTLVLEPIPYGRLKKVLKFVMEAIAEIAKGKDMAKEEAGRVIPELLMEHAAKILPMLFDPKKHPYMNEAWLEDNMTIPLVKNILRDAVVINDLSDFFGKMGALQGQTPSAPMSEKLPETAAI
jgi:hypothetical protein